LLLDPKVAHARATSEDIRACYRLLLGREPDEEGFRGWSEVVFKKRINPLDLALFFLNSAEYKSRQPAAGIPNYVTVKAAGLEFMLPENDITWAGLVRDGQYETWVKDKLVATLCPGDVFLDLGCNIGYFSTIAARAVGSGGQVIALDAAPVNAKLALLNAHRNGFHNVRVLPVAVSDRVETLVYRLDPGQSDTVLYQPGDQDLEKMHVTLAMRLDTLLAGAPRIDVVKMDVQGFEHKCILGAVELLRKHRPKLAIEYAPQLIRQCSGVEGVEFLNHLFGQGYRGGVLMRDGNLLDCGTDARRIHGLWQDDAQQYGVTHVDLWFDPQ
jgi:FkbM family methyltransferase